jgi:hypothetical protein
MFTTCCLQARCWDYRFEQRCGRQQCTHRATSKENQGTGGKATIIVVVHTYPPVSLTASVYHNLNDILFLLKAKVAELEDELENERALRAKVGYF